MKILIAAFALSLVGLTAQAQSTVPAEMTDITQWKAVYGRIEARDRLPARARLGGTLVDLTVSEGDRVTVGQVLGRVDDEKLNYQLRTFEGRRQAQSAQLDNAITELNRGKELLQRGVITSQRLDALQTQVDVLRNQIAATEAEMQVLQQRVTEGDIVSPTEGVVLHVPVSKGSVVLPGESVTEIGGGGFFLRLAVPERHADYLEQGAEIEIHGTGAPMQGKLVKVYPLIENGRVIADVEVDGLQARYVDARVLVRLPIGTAPALLVPATAVEQRRGLEFVSLAEGRGERVVVSGQTQLVNGIEMVEILSGLSAGDIVVTAHD